MTVKECAIIEAYTGVCMLTGDRTKYFYKYCEEIMGIPIYTHFFASESFQLQLKAKAKDDFVNLCRNSTIDKE